MNFGDSNRKQMKTKGLREKSVGESFLETLNDVAMVTRAGDLADRDSMPPASSRGICQGVGSTDLVREERLTP